MSKRFIATNPILYGNKQYKPGEELPTDDTGYVKAWTDAGSAVWKDNDANVTTKKRRTKAKSVTAPTGIEGTAHPATGAEPDIVGKLPSKKARGVIKEPSRNSPKSQE